MTAHVTANAASMRTSPAPYGHSGRNARGVMLHGMFEWMDRHVEGGRARVLSDCPPDLADYLRGRFLSAAWVDVFAVADLSVVAARATSKTYLATIRSMALEQCERDIKGIYEVVIRFATPEVVMARVPKSASLYFDFVRAEVEKIAPGHYRSTGRGVPVAAMQAYTAVTETFLVHVLTLTGAKNVRHRWLAPETEGIVDGVATVAARREIRWDP